MKKLFSAIFIVFLFSAAGFAQENQAFWQFYKGNTNEFSAEFPSLLKGSKITDFKTKKDLGNLYKSYFNRAFYFVAVCETTDCPQFEIIKILKFRARNEARSKFSEKTLDDSIIESSFADSEGFFQKIRQIKTERFYFIIHTVSETENNPDIERFLSSFQLTAINETAEKPETERFDKLLVSDVFEIKLPPPSRNSVNPNSTTTAVLPTKGKIESMPVAIQSKPRALYTDAARFYEISGEVILRVNFHSSKNITDITPLKKLPFGLTEQAIAAAGEIRFNPALRDGKPISVTKPVIYKFTIY
jgi:hypothetical protein